MRLIFYIVSQRLWKGVQICRRRPLQWPYDLLWGTLKQIKHHRDFKSRNDVCPICLRSTKWPNLSDLKGIWVRDHWQKMLIQLILIFTTAERDLNAALHRIPSVIYLLHSPTIPFHDGSVFINLCSKANASISLRATLHTPNGGLATCNKSFTWNKTKPGAFGRSTETSWNALVKMNRASYYSAPNLPQLRGDVLYLTKWRLDQTNSKMSGQRAWHIMANTRKKHQGSSQSLKHDSSHQIHARCVQCTVAYCVFFLFLWVFPALICV